jgi:bifunctional DNA-binding transcriptional regulator/antitoxin component of YhaV-PrlF toxin-antitoxin module
MSENLLVKTFTKVDMGWRVLIPPEIRRRVNLKKGMEIDIRLLKTDAGWLIMLQEVKSG